MAFLSALPSGGVCAVFTDAQLAKTSEAMSNTVVTWFFMAFFNAKFRGRSQSFGRCRAPVIQLLLQELSELRASKTPGLAGSLPRMLRSEVFNPIASVVSSKFRLPPLVYHPQLSCLE